MAKQRIVNTRFWNDTYVSELDPSEKLLFLYFLTNEHTNIAGIYEVPLKIIGVETGLDKEMIIKMLPRLEGKIFYIDGWVYIKNFAKYQNGTSENIQQGVEREKKLLPEKILLRIEEINQFDPPVPPPYPTAPLPKPKPKPKLRPRLKLKENFSDFEKSASKNEETTQEYSVTGLLPVSEIQEEAGQDQSLSKENKKERKPNYPFDACSYLLWETGQGKLDKSLEANLKCAKMALELLREMFHVEPPESFQMLCRIIDFALQDSFHVQNMTSMVYVYNNMQKLMKQMQAKVHQTEAAKGFGI